jgi:CheY-like chemotaxis protein
MKEVDMNQTVARELRLYEQERSLRILLADEDGDMRRLLALVLNKDGHEVVEVCDASELLEALASTLIEPGPAPFDLVICAHTLPGIPGLTVLAGLRARDRDTPFVLITEDALVQERGRRLGAAILDHPFNVRAIRDAIRRSADAAARGR